MLRSVLSVLAGIAVLTLASFAIEAALEPLSPPSGFQYAYGFLCVAAGGYTSARLAGRMPLRHAAVMGIIQGVLTIAAMFSPVGSHASAGVWIASAILTVPAALAGGFVHKRR